MGIINKLYDVHAVPSNNVQFPIDEEAWKNSPSQCNFGLRQKPPPGLPRLPMSIGTFSENRGYSTLVGVEEMSSSKFTNIITLPSVTSALSRC